MRTFLDFNGRRYRMDSMQPATHIVLLALNKEPFRPVEPTSEDLSKLTKEEAKTAMSLHLSNRAKFAHEEVSTHRFSLQPALWLNSEAEANAAAAEFRAETVSDGVPKYSEVVVLPVSGVIEHG